MCDRIFGAEITLKTAKTEYIICWRLDTKTAQTIVTTEVVMTAAISLFLSLIPPIFFKVSRQSACHRSFVYSDKIAAFIACQINLKKQGTGEVR